MGVYSLCFIFFSIFYFQKAINVYELCGHPTPLRVCVCVRVCTYKEKEQELDAAKMPRRQKLEILIF